MNAVVWSALVASPVLRWAVIIVGLALYVAGLLTFPYGGVCSPFSSIEIIGFAAMFGGAVLITGAANAFS